MATENMSENDLKDQGYFLESDIAVEGYNINSVSKKKLAIFDGFRVPALKTKTKFNWGLFLLWVMVFGGAMGISLKNPAFIGCGIPLAFCISYKIYYKYDDPDTVIQLDGSADTASKEENEQ